MLAGAWWGRYIEEEQSVVNIITRHAFTDPRR
jgi:hypothetical protein